MVRIIADSTADLGSDLLSAFGIETVPLSVMIGGKLFKDGVDIHQDELFSLVKEYNELPKTAAPSVGEFFQAFNHPGEAVFIGISSKLSATIQNATLAAQMFPSEKIQIIDSKNLSTGVGMLALAASENRTKGLSGNEITESLRRSIGKVRTAFVIDTMDYLHKGGRCTALQAIVGSMLQIHPTIEVCEDGSLGVRNKNRGSLHKCMQALLDEFKDNVMHLDPTRVFITTTSRDDSDIDLLRNGIKHIAPGIEILITRAGSVIASHCGPNTTGIIYMTL
jgi:DegV family protein with EDD domain